MKYFSRIRANLKRHNCVCTLSSKHTYRPMWASVVSQLFYTNQCFFIECWHTRDIHRRTSLTIKCFKSKQPVWTWELSFLDPCPVPGKGNEKQIIKPRKRIPSQPSEIRTFVWVDRYFVLPGYQSWEHLVLYVRLGDHRVPTMRCV